MIRKLIIRSSNLTRKKKKKLNFRLSCSISRWRSRKFFRSDLNYRRSSDYQIFKYTIESRWYSCRTLEKSSWWDDIEGTRLDIDIVVVERFNFWKRWIFKIRKPLKRKIVDHVQLHFFFSKILLRLVLLWLHRFVEILVILIFIRWNYWL